jgi:hypothetical protein
MEHRNGGHTITMAAKVTDTMAAKVTESPAFERNGSALVASNSFADVLPMMRSPEEAHALRA